MLDSLKTCNGFITAFETVARPSGIKSYLDANNGTYTSSPRPGVIKTQEIADIAQRCLHFLQVDSQDLLETRISLLLKLNTALQQYATRVENAIKSRWWYWILHIFGYQARCPEEIRHISTHAQGVLVELQNQRKKEEEKETAVIKIQSFLRGHLARQAADQEKVQSQRKREEAVITIQRFLRGHLVRKATEQEKLHRQRLKEQVAKEKQEKENLLISQLPPSLRSHSLITPLDILRLKQKVNELREQQSIVTSFKDSLGTVEIWSDGHAVLETKRILGRGQNKTVYEAIDLENGKVFASSSTHRREVEFHKALTGNKGIAQATLFKDISGERNKVFFCQDRYDCTLYEAMRNLQLTREDIKIILHDLLWGMKALESADSNGRWICHGDIKDQNVYIQLDHSSQRVVGAYIGDFGESIWMEPTEVKKHSVISPTRQDQRNQFVSAFFGKLEGYMRAYLNEKNPEALDSLCADDTTCARLFQEVRKEFPLLFEQLRGLHTRDPNTFWEMGN